MNSNSQTQFKISDVKYRIAQLEDLEPLYRFAENGLKERESLDEMELMMRVWESRFRKEALEHYLKLGWSFIAEVESVGAGLSRETTQVVGFFIGQPLLFCQGQTQSLWVEDIITSKNEIGEQIKLNLIEIAYKLARDKHFQRVLMPSHFQEELKKFSPKVAGIEEVIFAKTTK